MEFSPETKLNKHLALSYNSCSGSSQLDDGSSAFTWNVNLNQGLSRLPKDVPLKQLVSGSPGLFDTSLSDLEKTDKESSGWDTLVCIYAASITFAVGVTVALILHVSLWGRLGFFEGVVVSGEERCTALGHRILQERGSSVDAAIAAALCLGVVQPHASGVGGGGMMVVHDIRTNETRVINFLGTAPKTLDEEMLKNISGLKAGLLVGVPGLLRGLHCAHSLYGSLSWEDVVARAAAVAKEGFNVTSSLADAIAKVKGEPLSQRFRDTFLPGGHALLPGSFLRMSSLAGVLEAGLSTFYDGSIAQEMEDEVRLNGGVLSRDDISHYNVEVESPVEGMYNDFIVQVPRPPSAGAALMSVLKLVQGLHINRNNNTENQTHHWIAEAVKETLASAGSSGDPKYDSTVSDLLPDNAETELTAGQVMVMGQDEVMVSFASSLSTPFGSRLITRSGVILNGLILDFSWPRKTHDVLTTNQLGKRPLSSLMPILVVPAWHKCGIYMALSSSGGLQSLSVITQVLISALSVHKENNDSLSLSRLHSQHRPNRLLVDPELPEEGVESGKGHVVQRVNTNSMVQGILRNKDVFTDITSSPLLQKYPSRA